MNTKTAQSLADLQTLLALFTGETNPDTLAGYGLTPATLPAYLSELRGRVYRWLQSDYETYRDAIRDCTANPDHAMAYFLPESRAGFIAAERALLAFVREQRRAGLVLCPFSLQWCEPGETAEDNANERAYGGSVD